MKILILMNKFYKHNADYHIIIFKILKKLKVQKLVSIIEANRNLPHNYKSAIPFYQVLCCFYQLLMFCPLFHLYQV